MGLRWVEQESGRPVLHLWLNSSPRYCLPSLRCVFDLITYCSLAHFMKNSTFNLTCANNGSVNDYVYMYVCMYLTRHHNHQWLLGDQHSSRQWRTRGAQHWALRCFRGFTHGYSHKYNRGHMEARLVYLRPYWANEVKFVIYINILKVSLSATFNDVPELIVKHFVQFITIPLVHIFHSSFPTGYFAGILKLGEINPWLKRVMNNIWKTIDPYEYFFFFFKMLGKFNV